MYDNQEATISFDAMKLEDFGKLQERYQTLGLAHRAGAMLADAKPALSMAETILGTLSSTVKTKQLFDSIRKNSLLIGKMRPSDAKVTLMDNGNDFIDVTRKKIAAWRKTMERLSMGEGIVVENSQEFISSREPVCAAIGSVTALSNYLSVVQIAIGELVKTDADNAPYYNSMITKIRRCATLISDCENASCLTAQVH
jgi:hypothetical protein